MLREIPLLFFRYDLEMAVFSFPNSLVEQHYIDRTSLSHLKKIPETLDLTISLV